jgi:hypothetical protein
MKTVSEVTSILKGLKGGPKSANFKSKKGNSTCSIGGEGINVNTVALGVVRSQNIGLKYPTEGVRLILNDSICRLVVAYVKGRLLPIGHRLNSDSIVSRFLNGGFRVLV